MDTGANKNFVCERIAANSTKLSNPFKVQSAAGQLQIVRKIRGQFFKSIGIEKTLDFFVLPKLESFDGIIGDDTLRELEAVIDRKNDILRLVGNVEIKLKGKNQNK